LRSIIIRFSLRFVFAVVALLMFFSEWSRLSSHAAAMCFIFSVPSIPFYFFFFFSSSCSLPLKRATGS
jgi:hypothetical protein